MDALDTLFIMDLNEEFEDAAKWVENSLELNVVRINQKLIQCNTLMAMAYTHYRY